MPPGRELAGAGDVVRGFRAHPAPGGRDRVRRHYWCTMFMYDISYMTYETLQRVPGRVNGPGATAGNACQVAARLALRFRP